LFEQDGDDDAREAKLKLKQYEQPGELVTLPSGIQYRELLEGTGKQIALGSKVSMKCAPTSSIKLACICWKRVLHTPNTTISNNTAVPALAM
jgi:hypothetical protein